ncbi:MAG: FliH/SctL family protein [Planctomycetota bacterium]|jgi:flagellar biosynthesis/type III secretory pathway protein FliH
MNSSAERLRLPSTPSAVVVHDGPADQAIAAIFESRARDRERAAADAARAEAATGLEQLAAGFAAEQQSITDELTRAAVTLGVEVARAILRTELDAGRYELEPVLREALGMASEGRGEARVHVSPADAERLADVRLRAGTELVPDNDCTRGEIRVESKLGQVVRDPERSLDQVREALFEELSK